MSYVPDPIFRGAPQPSGAFTVGGFESLANFGWQSAVEQRASEHVKPGQRVVFNNTAAPWGEHGPLWGVRGYNVVGNLQDIELWRVGDWTNGREGTAFYLNVQGSLRLSRLRAVQCGAQAIQLVWRPRETLIHEPPSGHDLVELEHIVAIDCGAIVRGVAVRASWPLSIFSPGTLMRMDSARVWCELPAFTGDHGEECHSHGVLIVQEGEEGARTPALAVRDLRARIVKPDRSAMRLSGIDHATLECDLDVVGAPCVVDVIDTCDSVEIGFTKRAQVRVFKADDPWHDPFRVEDIAPGGKFAWSRALP